MDFNCKNPSHKIDHRRANIVKKKLLAGTDLKKKKEFYD